MRVLLVNDTTQQIGGAESYIHLLKAQLEGRGHEVVLFGANKGVKTHESPLSRWLSLKYYLRARQIYLQFRPHVIHAHNLSKVISPSVLYGFGRTPVIQTMHDYHLICAKAWMVDEHGRVVADHDSEIKCLLHHMPKKNLVIDALRQAKVALHRAAIRRRVRLYIVPSRNQQRLYAKRLNSQSVMYVPLMTPPYIKPSAPNLGTQILYIGRLSRDKGVRTLMEAYLLATRRMNDLHLTIIGSGPLETELKQFVTKHKLSQEVTVLGQIPHASIVDYLNRASVVVVPSACVDACPLTVLEAIAAGRPVIASNAGGQADVIKPGVNGWLFERENANDLADKLVGHLQNPSQAQEISLNQIKLAGDFSVHKHMETIISLYQQVAQR